MNSCVIWSVYSKFDIKYRLLYIYIYIYIYILYIYLSISWFIYCFTFLSSHLPKKTLIIYHFTLYVIKILYSRSSEGTCQTKGCVHSSVGFLQGFWIYWIKFIAILFLEMQVEQLKLIVNGILPFAPPSPLPLLSAKKTIEKHSK